MNPYLGAAGGAAGGGILGALGQVLEPLDYPRQALANLASPVLGSFGADALAGMPQKQTHAGMLPGLLGLGAGAASAFVPGLTPFAPMIGSAVAGLAQGVGQQVSPDEFQAPTTGQVSSAMGLGDSLPASMLTGMLTDPLTYAGALGGHGMTPHGMPASSGVGLAESPMQRLLADPEMLGSFQGGLKAGVPFQQLEGALGKGLAQRNKDLTSRVVEQASLDAAPAMSQGLEAMPGAASPMAQLDQFGDPARANSHLGALYAMLHDMTEGGDIPAGLGGIQHKANVWDSIVQAESEFARRAKGASSQLGQAEYTGKFPPGLMDNPWVQGAQANAGDPAARMYTPEQLGMLGQRRRDVVAERDLTHVLDVPPEQKQQLYDQLARQFGGHGDDPGILGLAEQMHGDTRNQYLNAWDQAARQPSPLEDLFHGTQDPEGNLLPDQVSAIVQQLQQLGYPVTPETAMKYLQRG